VGALKSWAQACQKTGGGQLEMRQKTGGGQPFLELYQAVAAKSNLKKHSPLSESDRGEFLLKIVPLQAHFEQDLAVPHLRQLTCPSYT